MAFFGTVEIIKERVEKVTKDMIKNKNCSICILPNSVKVIADEAFRKCKKLEKLLFVDENGNYVDNKIEVIGSSAFAFTKIKEFNYSHHLKIINTCAFYSTPLSSLQYKDNDGIESNLEKVYIAETNIKELVIPPSLTSIIITENIITSLICKDKDGNFVKSKGISTLLRCYPENFVKLKEVSLIGFDDLPEIQTIIERIPSLEKIHVSMEIFSKETLDISGNRLHYNRILDRNLHFILHGNVDSIYSMHGVKLLLPDKNTISITFVGKTKEINSNFFEYLANSELVIPEGVEIINDLHFRETNLKMLSLPSTLKKISNNNSNSNVHYSIIVNIYSTIPLEAYQNLCSYLDPKTSKIIIKGNLIEQEKDIFKSFSPNELTLEFQKVLFEPSKSIQEKSSSYQNNIDELKQELIGLMNLMPNDLKLKIKDRYNEIIDNYMDARKKEKNDILNDTHTFRIGYSYEDLYMSLLFLVNEIKCDKTAVFKLQEIKKYRKMLDDTSIINDNDCELSEIIQGIKLEIQKRTIEFNSISGFSEYGKIYIDKLKERVEVIFNNSEKVYQDQLKKAYGYNNLSINEVDSINVLKIELEKLLNTIKNSTLERCIFMIKSFYEKSDDINIKDLADNVKTLNYAVSKINSKQKQDDFEKLKRNYTNRYFNIIFSLIDDLAPNEELKELEQKLSKDLSLFVNDTIMVERENNIVMRQLEEVTNSYKFLLDEKEEACTVSDKLIFEIKKVGSNLEFTKDGIDIKELIYNKVAEIENKLRSAKASEIVSIMNEYYHFLVNIWFMVSELYSYEEKNIVLDKMI